MRLPALASIAQLIDKRRCHGKKIVAPNPDANHIAVFQEAAIRRTWHAGEWWFPVIDVIEALVGGDRPRKYWNDLKKKLAAEGYFEVSEKIGQ